MSLGNGEMGNEGGSKDDDEPDDDGFEDGETPKATPSRRRRHFGHDDDDNDGPAGATNRCILTWAWAWQWANGKVPCLNTLKGAPESQVHKEATPSSIHLKSGTLNLNIYWLYECAHINLNALGNLGPSCCCICYCVFC